MFSLALGLESKMMEGTAAFLDKHWVFFSCSNLYALSLCYSLLSLHFMRYHTRSGVLPVIEATSTQLSTYSPKIQL